MKKPATKNPKQNSVRYTRQQLAGYTSVHRNIVQLLQTTRQKTASAINALMTVTYWEVGRHIVEFEQPKSLTCSKVLNTIKVNHRILFIQPVTKNNQLVTICHRLTLFDQLVTSCHQFRTLMSWLQNVTDCFVHVGIRSSKINI